MQICPSFRTICTLKLNEIIFNLTSSSLGNILGYPHLQHFCRKYFVTRNYLQHFLWEIFWSIPICKNFNFVTRYCIVYPQKIYPQIYFCNILCRKYFGTVFYRIFVSPEIFWSEELQLYT